MYTFYGFCVIIALSAPGGQTRAIFENVISFAGVFCDFFGDAGPEEPQTAADLSCLG